MRRALAPCLAVLTACANVFGLDDVTRGDQASGSTSTSTTSTTTASSGGTGGHGGMGTGGGGEGATGTGGDGGDGRGGGGGDGGSGGEAGGEPSRGLCRTPPLGQDGQLVGNPGFESGLVGWSPNGLTATIVAASCEGAQALRLEDPDGSGEGDVYKTTSQVLPRQCVELTYSVQSSGDGSALHVVILTGTGKTFQRHYLAGGQTPARWGLQGNRCRLDQLAAEAVMELDLEANFAGADSYIEIDAVALSVGDCGDEVGVCELE